MSELKALIFDVDGTLADTERDGHRVAFNYAFAEAGLDWEWDEVTYGKLLAVTGGKERIRYYLQAFNTEFNAPEDIDSFVAELHKRKTHFYTEMSKKGDIPLRKGIQRLLFNAKKSGMRMAIATTTTPANVSTLLQANLGDDWEDLFEVVAAGDIVPEKKPAPDIYVWAMEKLNLRPEACMALEDSANGLKSALGSGIQSVVITVNGYTAAEDFTGASLVVDQLGEPGQAAQVIQGSLNGEAFVTLDALQQLHASNSGSR